MLISPNAMTRFLKIIRDKRDFYQRNRIANERDLIGKGTPAVRINAAKDRERVTVYTELLEIGNEILDKKNKKDADKKGN